MWRYSLPTQSERIGAEGDDPVNLEACGFQSTGERQEVACRISDEP